MVIYQKLRPGDDVLEHIDKIVDAPVILENFGAERSIINGMDPRIVKRCNASEEIRSMGELKFRVMKYKDYLKREEEYDEYFVKARNGHLGSRRNNLAMRDGAVRKKCTQEGIGNGEAISYQVKKKRYDNNKLDLGSENVGSDEGKRSGSRKHF